MSKMKDEARRLRRTLETGSVLSIDPASGATSMPGFALFDAGSLVESGVIRISPGLPLHRRLQVLGESLRVEFKEVDLLIVEDLPPFFGGAGGGFRTGGVISLHQSVGVIFACAKYKHLLKVSPQSWHAQVRKLPYEYVKTDERDAIAMAWTGFVSSGLILQPEAEGLIVAALTPSGAVSRATPPPKLKPVKRKRRTTK